MREKHMRNFFFGNMRKGSNFVKKMMMMGPEQINLKAKNEKKNTPI